MRVSQDLSPSRVQHGLALFAFVPPNAPGRTCDSPSNQHKNGVKNRFNRRAETEFWVCVKMRRFVLQKRCSEVGRVEQSVYDRRSGREDTGGRKKVNVL